MALFSLSPAKVVLLASHFATHADIDSLSSLTAQHGTIMRKELFLRILLTYLPETLDPVLYVPILKALASGTIADLPQQQYETSFVDDLSDEQASKKAKKLRLLQLSRLGSLKDGVADPLTMFLILRSYRMDEEAGMLAHIPDLLLPLLHHDPALGTWLVSTILPLLRKNCEYYPRQAVQYSLLEFQNLNAEESIDYLLAETGLLGEDHSFLGRDLRGLVGPWLYDETRWKRADTTDDTSETLDEKGTQTCPGWERVLKWLVTQASTSWRIAHQAIEQWDGPQDVDLGDGVSVWLQESQQRYLDQTYARATLASIYLIPEATVEALRGAFQMSVKITSLMDQDPDSSLDAVASSLLPVRRFDAPELSGTKAAGFLRSDLLSSSNPLTAPNPMSTDLVKALVLSAFLLTRVGVQCTVRRAGDLAFIRDTREQKGELARLIRAVSGRAARNNDECWARSRREVLWLHSWGQQQSEPQGYIKGIFNQLSLEYVETELLKALLADMRTSL